MEVGPDAVLGGVGAGDELQRAWFTEERLGIAARGIGAMTRLLEETLAWATGREQGGARLWDHQGVAFPLADSAADAAAGRLLCLEVARLADEGADPKVVHAKAAMAKLFVSEAAGRCADRAVQAFGGRGYRRDNVAERLWRELRVDRIWEGTSEIQRLIVARSLERRGCARAAVRGGRAPRRRAARDRRARPGEPARRRRAAIGAQTYATPVSGAGAPGGTNPDGIAAFFPAGDARMGLHFALLSSMNAKRAGERAFKSCGA